MCATGQSKMKAHLKMGKNFLLKQRVNAIEQLEIIEVQSGTYLGEDDIVRFEDIYGRVKD
jgi:mannose-6-phosphate isomerase-like protein (cupin superfamily)